MSIETFASPGLRWGLLLNDHPGATHKFDVRTGDDLGIPSAYGGGTNEFCVCTITFPAGAGMEPVIGYKPMMRSGKPDEWTVLCTKALGRALKRAGYPDDLKDLKALVLWRQRDAEIEAIRGGSATALERADKPLEIEAGGRDEEIVGVDDDYADERTPDADAEITDAEIIPDRASTIPQADYDDIVEACRSLQGDDLEVFRQFLESQGVPRKPSEWTDDHIAEVDAWLSSGGE